MAAIPKRFKHQNVSCKFFASHERALDLSDPGTGKTRVQIDGISRHKKLGGKAVLVLAPKSLLENAWANDIKRFAPEIKVSIANAENREKSFVVDADVYVTNVDAVRWLAKQPPAFFKRFDTLIIDEISCFKHPTSQRSKAVNTIKKHFPRRYGLTGTPMANSVTDIWNLLFIIDDGRRLGTSFFHFRNSTQTGIQVGPSIRMKKWVDKPGAEIAISGMIQDIVIRHKLEECIDLPENHSYSVEYKLTSAQRKLYDSMHKHAVAELNSGRTISASNAADMLSKLMQIASGASYSDMGSGNDALVVAAADSVGYVPIDDSRTELALDLVEARQQCVVFFQWRHQKDMFLAGAKARGISVTVVDGTVSLNARKTAVEGFQNGMFRVLLAHPASAAHGLTLTKGTTTVWLSPCFNLEFVLQGNRRIYRAGQTQRTETIYIVGKDTVEERVLERLNEKQVAQMNMLDFLKTSL